MALCLVGSDRSPLKKISKSDFFPEKRNVFT